MSLSPSLERPYVIFGTLAIPVEVVSTPEGIRKGLAHRRSLEASEGMLFVFDHSALLKFWMRGMRFPLDIIWIGADRRVVDITPRVPPVSFLAALLARPVFYTPSVPAQYVLEVNAGFCDQHTIQAGDLARFESIAL